MDQDFGPAALAKWRQLGDQFESLVKEEQAHAGPLLHATVAPSSIPFADVNKWRLEGATSDRIRERFALIGTDAGLALGIPPDDASGLDFWLHSLHQNVSER